jgi:Ca2+-binding RTX toxin-like protein
MDSMISGQPTVQQGVEFTLNLSNVDPGDDPIIGWSIVWDLADPLTPAEAVIGNQPMATHIYNTPGIYTIFAFATNDDYIQSAPLVLQVTVEGGLAPGTHLVGQTLFIIGSTTGTGNDAAVISQSGSNINVNATVNATNPFTASAAAVQQIVVQLGSGNDVLVTMPNITKPMTVDGGDGNDVLTSGGGDDVVEGGAGIDILYGGAGADALLGEIGNDTLFGGSGNDVLIGGEGNDLVFGDLGQDLLIGGLGQDLLNAGDGEDILIGGRTRYDEYDAVGKTGIDLVMATWTGAGNFGARHGLLTASTLLETSDDNGDQDVFDDDANDTITGGSAADLIFGDNVAGDGFVDSINLQAGDVLVPVTEV